MTHFIELTNVSKTIKNQQILNNINLSLDAGKAYGFIGRNGSGKTMLFKAVCGLITPSSGTVFVGGKQIGKDIDFPERTGIIIEQPGLVPYMTALDNLRMFALVQKHINDRKIVETLELLGLDPSSRKKVHSFSLGMKQRLAIAQAIMEDPELLVLDEPMNSLDREGVDLVKRILLDRLDRGCTLLLSSHISGDIEELCPVIFEMNGGILSERKK